MKHGSEEFVKNNEFKLFTILNKFHNTNSKSFHSLFYCCTKSKSTFTILTLTTRMLFSPFPPTTGML